MNLGRYLILLAACLIAARPAFAKTTEDKERAARAACLSGDVAKGVSLLSELFVKTEDAVYIYNQGRCFEQNHRYEDAISRFQEFLRVGRKLSKADKADAQKHIADCQELLAKQKAVAPAGTAGAHAAESKESKDRAAKKACLTGDPAGGVAILTDLYIDTNDPTYLFNQGRCFEQNQRYQEAIGRFREYLVKAKNLPPAEKADTNKHIANCESYLRGTSGESPAAQQPARPTQPDDPGSAAVVASSAPSGSGRPGSGLRAAGLVTAAVGGAGLVTGLVLNLKVNSMSSDLENEYDPSVDSSRKSYKTAGWTAYSAGAALVVGGAVLYYLGWRHGRTSSVAVLPAVGDGMAGTFVVGAF
jgi:tetratricopeptide (TPR) repeat protein